jgi:hypothetical protein
VLEFLKNHSHHQIVHVFPILELLCMIGVAVEHVSHTWDLRDWVRYDVHAIFFIHDDKSTNARGLVLDCVALAMLQERWGVCDFAERHYRQLLPESRLLVMILGCARILRG